MLYLCGTTLNQLLYLSVHIALRRDASDSNKTISLQYDCIPVFR